MTELPKLEPLHVGECWEPLGGKCECVGGRLTAAVQAVLDLHVKSTLDAGVLEERFGPGRCAFCRHGEPLGTYHHSMYGPMLFHCHADPEPHCVICASTDEDRTYEAWPCPTVRAASRALEGS